MRTLVGRKALAQAMGLDSVRDAVRLVEAFKAPVLVVGDGAGRRYYANPDAVAEWWRGVLSRPRALPSARARSRAPKRTRARRS